MPDLSPDLIAVISFVTVFALMLLRVPVGMAMGLVGVSGYGYLTGSTPALMMAIAQRWPALHGDPDVDADIYQNLKPHLPSVPPALTAAAEDLWTTRLVSEGDPLSADHLLGLAQSM